jgi:hypothetical protein
MAAVPFLYLRRHVTTASRCDRPNAPIDSCTAAQRQWRSVQDVAVVVVVVEEEEEEEEEEEG